MNTKSLILLTILAAGCIACLSGCEATKQKNTVDPAGVENLAYDAANIGTAYVLATQPQYRPQFDQAYAALDDTIKRGAITPETLHLILAQLPVKELKSPEAVLSYALATSIYHRATGNTINAEVSNRYAAAAAVGIRDGMKTALGK